MGGVILFDNIKTQMEQKESQKTSRLPLHCQGES